MWLRLVDSPLRDLGGLHYVEQQAERGVSKARELLEDQRGDPPQHLESAQGGSETFYKVRRAQRGARARRRLPRKNKNCDP